jgi:hypothetical protein
MWCGTSRPTGTTVWPIAADPREPTGECNNNSASSTSRAITTTMMVIVQRERPPAGTCGWYFASVVGAPQR